jgi:alkylhydroperoxidase family enzyme
MGRPMPGRRLGRSRGPSGLARSNRATRETRSIEPDYSTSPLFTEAERAALDYAAELTRDKKVSQTTFDRLAAHYSEREICEIVWLVATEHVYNMTNLGLNIHSDMLCDISRKASAAALG